MADILVIRSPGLNPARLPHRREKNIEIIVVDSKNSERLEVNSTKKNHSKNSFSNGPEYSRSIQRSNQKQNLNQNPRSNQKHKKINKKNNNNNESNTNKKEKSRRFTIGGKKNKTKKNRRYQ